MPFLINHYYIHKADNKHLSLISYLGMHYISENGTDKDTDEDNRLPFKSADLPVFLSMVSLLPPNCTTIAYEPVNSISGSFRNYTPPFASAQYLSAIWQPPRFS